MKTRPVIFPPEWIVKELKEWLKYAQDNNDVFLTKAIPIKMKKRYSFIQIKNAIEYNISKKCELADEISALYADISSIIEMRVHEGALSGKLQANIAQLTLKAKHKWEDKQTIDQKTTIETKNTDELEEETAKMIADVS